MKVGKIFQFAKINIEFDPRTAGGGNLIQVVHDLMKKGT
jgi:hypothetical protein